MTPLDVCYRIGTLDDRNYKQQPGGADMASRNPHVFGTYAWGVFRGKENVERLRQGTPKLSSYVSLKSSSKWVASAKKHDVTWEEKRGWKIEPWVDDFGVKRSLVMYFFEAGATPMGYAYKTFWVPYRSVKLPRS